MLKGIVSSEENSLSLNKPKLSIQTTNTRKPMLIIECQFCQTEYESPYTPGKIMKFLKEFGEYENFRSEPCPSCGTVEIFNMNLPTEEMTEEFFEKVDMLESERMQRRNLNTLLNDLKFEMKEIPLNESNTNET